MRAAFYEIMRKRRAKPIGALPLATFGASLSTCAGLLLYGDGIECAAVSLPSAPSIAKLGRGIQNLHEASLEVRSRESNRIQNAIEALRQKLKKFSKILGAQIECFIGLGPGPALQPKNERISMKKGKYMASEEEERGTEEPLSPVSRLLSSLELCAVIVVTLGLKTRCNISSVVAGIKESLIKLPRFSYTKSDLSSESVDEIQPKKVIHRIINFDDVKLVKNIMQMKVNDVLLGMTQAGLSRYLSRKYADEDTTTEKKKVLDRIHLRGTVAVVQAISKRLFDHTTLTYLNVMGPDKEISIFDQPISYLAASALTGSQVLNIHFVSYVNKLTISLAVDATVIPDPHRLCDDLVESLNIIKSTALEKFRIS
ncbi:hypothetical protein Bca101_040695 [Brassica carinata]